VGSGAAMTTTQKAAFAAIVALTAAAGAAHYLAAPAVLSFVLATFALAGLAWVVSFATEQVGSRKGPAVTGLLQSTLGNLPEFFVVVFALRAGQTVVAETSIVGSFFANALLVLGLVVIVGARRETDGVMRFSPKLPRDTVTLLLPAVMLVVLIGISIASSDKASHHVTGLSVVGALALLAVYTRWLPGYLRGEGRVTDEAATELGVHHLGYALSIALLVLGAVGAAFVSDWFVAALQPAIDKLHISETFAGLIVVAIAGNAVENTAGITLAAKGKADLAISVVKNSVSQVIVFLYPALILVSLLFRHQLTFALSPTLIGALVLTTLALWQITGDGEAAEFEGWALVALFVVLATLALYE